MFALFFSLYHSMFRGSWKLFSNVEVNQSVKNGFDAIGKFLTSLIGDKPVYETLGTDLILIENISNVNTISWMNVLAFVLALITSIGIVVMAVKGIKRVFGVFFGLMR